jgi:uncharacterized Fe-S cluster-containing MiaB family protein
MNEKHKRQLLVKLATHGCNNKRNSDHCMYCPIAAPCNESFKWKFTDHASSQLGGYHAQNIAREELDRLRKLEYLEGLQ